jgi:hypothetical protein
MASQDVPPKTPTNFRFEFARSLLLVLLLSAFAGTLSAQNSPTLVARVTGY